MIAKDFTLQSLSIHNSSTSLSIAIECHELMIRWHIYMTYILRFEGKDSSIFIFSPLFILLFFFKMSLLNTPNKMMNN